VTGELRAGLATGVVGAVVAGALVLFAHPASSRHRQPVPIAGTVAIAATLVALASRRPVPLGLVIAVVGVAIVCSIPPSRLPASTATALCAPLGWVMAMDLAGPRWLRVLVAVVASAGAVAAARTEAGWHDLAVTPGMLAITAMAIFLAVPDTEEAAVFLGAVLPVAVLGWPLRLVSLGRAGAGGAVVLGAWVVATGGRSSPAAVVGALACFALLIGLAAGRRLAPESSRLELSIEPDMLAIAVLLVHGSLALFASRAGAVRTGLTQAIIVAAVVLVCSLLAGAALEPPERRE
jgi:hypothetical protein